MLNNLILATTMPDWLSTIYPFIYSFIVALMVIASIAIIVIVIKMDSVEGAAGNSITGASGIQESYYQKNIGSSKEGRLKKLIIICSVAIAVLTIIYFIFSGFISSFA